MKKTTEDIGFEENKEIDHGEDREEAENVLNNEVEEMNGKYEVPQLPKYHKTYVPGRGFERYNNSLKNYIPFRRKGRDTGTMPIDRAGLFSYMTLSWISKFMYQAYKKELKAEELPLISPYDACEYNADRLELLWNKELANNGPEKASFLRVVWRFSRTGVLVCCLIQSFGIFFAILSNTVLMRGLLEYLQSGSGSYEEGMKWVLLLTLAESTRVITWMWARTSSDRTALRLRSACLTLIYRKLIRVNNLGSKNIGEVINVFSNDAQRIFEVIIIGPLCVDAPISTIYGVFYILHLLSPMALLAIITLIAFFAIQSIVSKLIKYLQTKKAKISDLRVRLMNEILDCIKPIKMYAWEKRFSEDVLDTRKKERKVLLKTSYCRFLNSHMTQTIPVISSIISLLAHVSGGYNLIAAQVFPYTSFLNSRLHVALSGFLLARNSLVSADISIKRMESLLLLKDGGCEVTKPILKSQAVTISHGTFACHAFDDQKLGNSQPQSEKLKNKRLGNQREQEKLNQPADNNKNVDILFDISFEAAKGKLVGICGSVGSGKSSLLLAALGQLRISKGQVMRDGSCAYVSQQAWVSNATLRENILFGDKFDQSRYYKAIDASNLSQDIDMMPGGDQTEIGEKGVNLSGGQKQRVALARALYADRDIYFLDDPLSAVDSRVGARIFDNLILGALREKTVLFVTHQIQYLNRCDDVYMLRDGKIIEHGTHDELINLGSEYALMVTAVSTDSERFEDRKIDAHPQSVNDRISQPQKNGTSIVTSEGIEKSETPAATSLIVAENLQKGSIQASTYRTYIKAAGGYGCAFAVVLMSLINAGGPAFGSWWLAIWIQAGGGNTTIVRNNVTILSDNVIDNPNFDHYRMIYGGTIGIIIVTSILLSLVFTQVMIRASTKLHNDLFTKLIASPMRFFDTTPSGRIQHLFSKDMDEVDTALPNSIETLLQAAVRISSLVSIISFIFPWFTLPVCVIVATYYFTSKIFRVAIRDFKRMENQSRAPVLSFVTATVQGLSTIHAFGKENLFKTWFNNFGDVNSKHHYMCTTAMRWLLMRIDALSVVTISTTAFLVVIFRDQVSPAFAGLALAYSNQITGILPYATRILMDAEISFISVERISHYLGILKSEEGENKSTVKPLPSWPEPAEIRFRNVSLTYGDGTPIVLKNVSFTVKAGEKIGIVGRTGSGKSSLTVALFRLVELAEGKIEIDDVDISEISLTQLRTKLSIIPQDPVLFSGTIRSNLDPFKLYTDAEIWEALEKTELKGRVQSITGQLDASVGFGGDNLSVGERQLLCLARALLRNSKILVLDEATAAVDPETEIVVQDTIQREFSHCTILTIAHRLQTVCSLSRVLVMDDGKVLEFDTPSNLLGNQCSEFSRMMAAAKQSEHR